MEKDEIKLVQAAFLDVAFGESDQRFEDWSFVSDENATTLRKTLALSKMLAAWLSDLDEIDDASAHDVSSALILVISSFWGISKLGQNDEEVARIERDTDELAAAAGEYLEASIKAALEVEMPDVYLQFKRIAAASHRAELHE